MRSRRPSMQSRSLLIYILIILLLFITFLNFFGALGIISCKLIKIVIQIQYCVEIEAIPLFCWRSTMRSSFQWPSNLLRLWPPKNDVQERWRTSAQKGTFIGKCIAWRSWVLTDKLKPGQASCLTQLSFKWLCLGQCKAPEFGCWQRSILIFGKRLTQRGSRLLPWQYLEPQKASGCLNCEFHLACP